jgi:LAO/AO transport system kinase
MRKQAITNWPQLLEDIQQHAVKQISRGISLVENEAPGYEQLLLSLPPNNHTKIIGITGPPGAGKSTLVDALIGAISQEGKKVGVLCVDPSSPFNLGALLGDRIRMSEWYNDPNVFIRSLATRGSLGGLHPRIIEITELMKAAAFDFIIVETVGVGQSEVEIVGLADVTVVVMVPEAGDEVQTMKAGLMEIADIFVVNKADRPDADHFVRNLRLMLAPAFNNHVREVPVIKTIASQKQGIAELYTAITILLQHAQDDTKKAWLLTERAYYLVQQKRMKDIRKEALQESILQELRGEGFNLYRFVEKL